MKLQLLLDGDVLLTKKSLPISNITFKHNVLVAFMQKTMKDRNGLGISAVQVGRLLRLILVNVKDTQRTMINPEILSFDGERISRIEGCLSFPDVFKYQHRPQDVVVRYKNTQGDVITESFSGLSAQVIIHECFHLEGITLLHKDIDNVDLLLYTDPSSNIVSEGQVARLEKKE